MGGLFKFFEAMPPFPHVLAIGGLNSYLSKIWKHIIQDEGFFFFLFFTIGGLNFYLCTIFWNI